MDVRFARVRNLAWSYSSTVLGVVRDREICIEECGAASSVVVFS